MGPNTQGGGMSPQQMANQQAQSNAAARRAILSTAIDMWLPIAQNTLAGTLAGQVVNIPLRNVGLVKRLVVKLTGSFAQGAAETQTLTKLGICNAISNFTLTDLQNQTRINTAGWHLHYLATARRQQAFGAAFVNDSPTSIGSNFTVIKAPSSVTTVQAWSVYYEVPLAYGDFDLRGSIYAAVVNATWNLQFTINPNFSVASGTDATLACYQSSTAQIGVLSNITYQVYQNFLDQLPLSKNGPVLPLQDIATAYQLVTTSVSAIVPASDNTIPYANFRNFMSTFCIYDNNGNLNNGSDINYWSLQSANYTNIFKLDPQTVKLLEREILADDMPLGMYYFDHRRRPISTTQFGNMQLIVNPITAPAGTVVYVGFEALAIINQLTGAGSLFAS